MSNKKFDMNQYLNENKIGFNINESEIDGHEVDVKYNKSKDSLIIKVKTPDNYNWSIERIPASVGKEIVDQLQRKIK